MNKNTQPPLIVLVLTLLPVGYLLYAALNVAGGKPPWETLSLAGLNYTLVGGLLIVAAAVVGILAYASARIKKPYEPIWAPLHSSQVSKAFCRHIERNSVPAIDAGYIPMGLYLAQKAFLGQIESFCLLHPQGHSAMRITQFSPVKAIEIQSFLNCRTGLAASVFNRRSHSTAKCFAAFHTITWRSFWLSRPWQCE